MKVIYVSQWFGGVLQVQKHPFVWLKKISVFCYLLAKFW